MENEIKVNEYVRIADGTIARVVEIKNQDSDVLNYYCLDNNMGTLERSIVKHLENIIDLIEVGDYVNGQKVVGISNISGWIDTKEDVIYKDHIKSIVTKEQFESISYKVKE